MVIILTLQTYVISSEYILVPDKGPLNGCVCDCTWSIAQRMNQAPGFVAAGVAAVTAPADLRLAGLSGRGSRWAVDVWWVAWRGNVGTSRLPSVCHSAATSGSSHTLQWKTTQVNAHVTHPADQLFTHYTYIYTHNRLTAFGTTRVSQYQKGKTNLDFTEARDSEWQWHQLGHMQVCTSLQTDNHASTPPLSFYRPDTLHAAQPTASKHWRQYINIHTYKFIQRQKSWERIWGAGKGWLDGKGRLEKMEF